MNFLPKRGWRWFFGPRVAQSPWSANGAYQKTSPSPAAQSRQRGKHSLTYNRIVLIGDTRNDHSFILVPFDLRRGREGGIRNHVATIDNGF